MKTKIYSFQIVLILLFLSKNINSQTNNSTIWNEESLKIYIEKNILQSNTEKNSDDQFLLIDPEQSLNEKTKISLQIIINSIRKEYNINNILFLLKSTESSFNKDNFLNLINIIKTKLNLDSENLISTLISIKEPKIFIIKGNIIKEKISDNKLEKLFQNLEKNLKTEEKSEISKVIVDYYDNIYNILRTNSKNSKNFFVRYKGIIIFVVLIIVIIILVKYFSGESTDLFSIIAQKETKIISFLEKNKHLSFKELLNRSCILCLENYDKDESHKGSQSFGNSNYENSNTRKISSASNTNVAEISDKIYLPCKHVFHEACLMKWKIFESRCPLCRSALVFDPHFKAKIIKFAPNINWLYNENSKFRLAIEDFMRIQKTFYPHMIHNQFASKVIDTYKIKFEKEPHVICVSPETLICKTLPSEDRNVSKYDQLEDSTQNSTDEKRTGKKKDNKIGIASDL